MFLFRLTQTQESQWQTFSWREEDKSFVGEGFNLVILEGHHQPDAVDIFHKASKHPHTVGYLCMHLIMRSDEAEIEQAGPNMLRQLCNTYSALVCHDFTLVHTLKMLTNFPETFYY